MEMPAEVAQLYSTHYLVLGRPVLASPVLPSDIELLVDEAATVLTLARCPRIYGRNLSLRFLHHNTPYLLDAVHQLQLLGGAGRVWRRIISAAGLAPHWRQVHVSFRFSEDFVGRPFDWPDKHLPQPDPVYELPPGAPDTVTACLTSLFPF
jgi:hypothetical protein